MSALFAADAPSADTQPPTAPGNLQGQATSATQINLGWSVATDNVGVNHYDVFRGGSYLTATTDAHLVDVVSPSATYTYAVKAIDAAGNASAASNGVSVTTPAQSGTGWPNASNTGVPPGTVLSVVNGSVTVTASNTVIDGKDIRGCVLIKAPGAVIRRSKISCPGSIVVAAFSPQSGGYAGVGLTIEDSEIDCKNSSGGGTNGTAIGDTNFTATRVNIHDCENGFDIDNDVVIQDSFIHDLFDDAVTHTDGIQFSIGKNIAIRHNAIFVRGTSAIIMNSTSIDGAVIANNLLAGGAYALYCPPGSSKNVRVIDNRFSRVFYPTGGAYGPWTDCERVTEVRGNVWDDTGIALPGQP